eukprot:TRINITY_DN14567_c0_g3_i1.p1 TRINITY_DN14567_c0_g3~~TRINITY_DN14567_c0_g3_i1.p1  ORF type:complete len:444 (+),score=89.89 TRINITY_DN14567_c0_g3_i1:40-1371(+)
MAASAAAGLSSRVEYFARRTATAVRLDDLYRWGQGDVYVRLRMARFLHKEVAIRNAQLCKELCLLPFGLAETQGISKVVSCFSSYVDDLAESPAPSSEDDTEGFAERLRGILADNTGVVSAVAEAVSELRDVRGDAYEELRPEVDLILDRFFIKRIGLRFLLEHYIESAVARPGVSGIIHSDVAVGSILRSAAHEAQELCRERYGIAPEVIVQGDGPDRSAGFGLDANLTHNRNFTYVPSHLHVSCSVLLQNACFAVAQACTTGKLNRAVVDETGAPSSMPVVSAIFAYGQDEVAIRVSDQGGGIARSDLDMAWSYFGGSDSRGFRHSAPLGSGNPLGVGLPLARLHARYYGGDLVLKSIEGFGTDAYLFLNRLGSNCEKLPYGVRVSPAMRDSSVGEAASIRLDSLGNISEQEEATLMRRLREYRTARATERAQLGSSVAPP